MGVVAELVLIRHGQSTANVAFPLADAQDLLESGLTGRDTDVELTELGVEQAAAVGRWLAALPGGELPEVVVTSPYLRARETWRIAAATSGLSLPAPGTDDRLVDRLVGELEMLTHAAIRQRFPAEPARFEQAGEYAYRPPGGETFGDIAVRLTSFLDDLNREHADERVLVVAHDSVVLMMRYVIEGLDWTGLAAIVAAAGPVRNASITSFTGSSGGLVLDRYNTVGHLA
ncbi:histidine phosphatase family protein [Actinoplanes sp. ATCC 53533]|uniref:histidine phosphatase family protein n=1 Tax=Actinoplanes sp. ATCC 53533 TaxID=1288362 RepID=UPI000F7896F5|nr:histidine phosphatase family protein [Actinoplanes sp. ATCC 53533]RSM72124.1 histidine phosphatase family protein [Actinoplanes sp. ATCC 53533]